MMRLVGDIQHWLYGGVSAQLKALSAGFDIANLLTAMAIASAFGMIHALMPGHGKAVIVSYYLGRPGQILGGVMTSAVLALTHVGSAIILVLAGFIVIRSTIGGVGRAPAFETVSAAMIIATGLWLLIKSLRGHEHGPPVSEGRALAVVTGLVPCPLTTFIMVYATAQGIVLTGLVVTIGMALGMTATIASFAIAAVLLRERVVLLFERSEYVRKLLSHGLELASALAIIMLGTWLLVAR